MKFLFCLFEVVVRRRNNLPYYFTLFGVVGKYLLLYLVVVFFRSAYDSFDLIMEEHFF